MTVLNPENKTSEAIQAPKSDTNIEQNKPDTNLTQKTDAAPDQKDAKEQEDPNWRAFREARKKDRIEREQAEKKAAEKEAELAALKAAMEATFSKSAPTPQAYQQYYGINQSDPVEETEEQKIERKVNQIIEKKEKEYAKMQEEVERREYPNRLRKDFPDFGHVCSQENLDYLDYHYPEVSRPLNRLSEGYDKWSDIYHAVKKFIPNYSSAKKEAKRADLNSQMPKSMSSTVISPSGEKVRDSWQDIEARRAENWARMQKRLKGLD